MNRNMVVAEWNRARESLRAAETLTRDGLYADAISRAYYAILHAAKAALHVHDIVAESHPAVRRMFGLHLVKAGEIETECRLISQRASTIAWRPTTTWKYPFHDKRPGASAGELMNSLSESSAICSRTASKKRNCANASGAADEKERSTT